MDMDMEGAPQLRCLSPRTICWSAGSSRHSVAAPWVSRTEETHSVIPSKNTLVDLVFCGAFPGLMSYNFRNRIAPLTGLHAGNYVVPHAGGVPARGWSLPAAGARLGSGAHRQGASGTAPLDPAESPSPDSWPPCYSLLFCA